MAGDPFAFGVVAAVTKGDVTTGGIDSVGGVVTSVVVVVETIEAGTTGGFKS